MDFSTTYGRNSVTTETPDAGVVPGTHGPAMGNGLGGLAQVAQLLAAKRAEDDRRRAVQMAALRSNPVIHNMGGFNGPANPVQDEMDRIKLRDMKLDQQAKEHGPALHYTYPYGSAGFLTTDPDSMNAYQRKYYLPQESHMAGPLIPNSEANDVHGGGPAQPKDDGTRADFFGTGTNDVAGQRERIQQDVYEQERQKQINALYGRR